MLFDPNHRYLIALGSNLGDRAAHIEAAVAALRESVGPILALSPLYPTEPLGAADQLFLNAALTIGSVLSPEAMLAVLLRIEAEQGRCRGVRWGNRCIDLDLILWQERDQQRRWHSKSWSSETLSVPHPEALHRDFVVVPGCDVAPSWLHPTSGQTLAEECEGRRYRLVSATAAEIQARPKAGSSPAPSYQ